MNSNTHLFDLIKSMSKTEKRYFKLNTLGGHTDEENNYVRLFDVISKQKEYNDNAIRSEFKNEKLGKNLSAQKYQLHEMILKSMNNYKSNASINFRLLQMCGWVETLFEKGLFEQSEQIIKRARKTSEQHHDILMDLLFLRMEEQIIDRDTYPDNYEEKLNNLFYKRKTKVKEYMEWMEVKHLSDKVANFERRYGIAKNKKEEGVLKRLGKHPLMKKDEKKMAYKSKLRLYHAKAQYYLLADDLSSSLYFSSKTIALIPASPSTIFEWRNYVSLYHNHLTRLIKNKQYTETETIISELKKTAALSELNDLTEIRISFFRAIYSNELNLYMVTGNYQKGIFTIKEMEKGFKKYRKDIGNAFENIFYYLFSLMYFQAQQYKESLFWLNKILNNSDNKLRTDIQGFARILNLIIHFELGNYLNLPYYFKSTYRYLAKKGRTFKVEALVMDTIRKSKNYSLPKEMIALFVKLKTQLVLFEKDRFEKQAFDYFDFISWLDSKIEKKSFAEVVQKKAQLQK